MTIVKCDVCETEWDPRQQAHRRGVDCAGALKEKIDSLYKSFQKLHEAFQTFVEAQEQKDGAVIKAFEDESTQIGKLHARFDALAKRVTLLEHPEMKKLRRKGEPVNADPGSDGTGA